MGEAHARALAAEGARVVIGDVLEAEGAAVADDLGDDARFAALDVTDEGSWQAAVSFAEDAFGPISVLVNNAGVLAIEPIAELAIEEWRRVHRHQPHRRVPGHEDRPPVDAPRRRRCDRQRQLDGRVHRGRAGLGLHRLEVGAARADQGGGDRVRARPHPGQLAASRA